MTADRVIATILGGAIGDGWGNAVENHTASVDFEPPPSLVVSDDTQLTLATCEAVLETGSVDPERIAARFLVWFRAGKLTGLGSSTLKALRDLDVGGHWALSGARGERAAGNGAAMRVAPLAFLLDPDNQAGRRILRDVCRITHHHDEAYLGGLAVVAAVRLVSTEGYEIDQLVSDVAQQLPDSQVRDRLRQLAKLPSDATPAAAAREFGNTGFVVDSVPLALFAASAIGHNPFETLIRETVMAGGDADTIASIVGQIAGAAVGLAALPSELLDRLHDAEQLSQTA